jgi:leucyl-tRNA synthetase
MTEHQHQSSDHPGAPTYDVVAAQERWRRVWDELNPFQAADDGSRERRYALTMFPYPSGDLHMGHAEVFALHDVIARYWWQRGYDVLNPIGWDSFGLPAENAAIKRDEHPATYTYANIETQAESLRRYGVSFDWSRRLHTSDPEYYRWTQWLFLRFRERGLAYRKFSPVNWCPNDQTVLANEQVIDGRCERCGAEVTKRELSQWYFKVTDYAQRLLDDMDQLADTWPDRVLAMQRNWIGRSVGAHIRFDLHLHDGSTRPLTVYTTRPDTVYGATFMVVAADAGLAAEICAPGQRATYDEYVAEVRKASDIDRLATDRPKTGVDLGVTAVNPATGEEVAVWAADYVLADYGTGAIMAGPGLRREVRPAGPAGGGHRGGQPRGDLRRDHRQRALRELRAAGRADRQGHRHRHGHRAARGRRPGRGRGELPAAGLAAVAAAVLGLPDPHRALPLLW